MSNDEERYLLQVLADMRASFERDAKPYIDRLVYLRNINPSPSITLTLDQAREFIELSMNGSCTDETKKNIK